MKRSLQHARRAVRRVLWFVPAAILSMSTAPTAVTLYGDFQSELGCATDNDPACTSTDLTYSGANDKWIGSFTIPAGSFSYRPYLNHTTAGTFGPVAITGTGVPVKFYYDDPTGWAGDSAGSTIATLAGDFQSELGCTQQIGGAGGDWEPPCLRSMLTDDNADGIYTFTTPSIPAGPYQFKVAYDEAWSTSYGDQGGNNNIHFTVTQSGAPVTFRYNPRTHWTFLGGAAAPPGGPASVTIAGTFQSELGCTQQIGGSGGDWEPPCAATHLAYDAEDDLWEGTFAVPAGAQQYKAALNDLWDVSYGTNGGGGNAGFTNPADGPVKFYYDDKTHVVTDSLGGGGPVAIAVGDWQNQVGCGSPWDPSCLRGFMADPDGDGVYDVETAPVPPGTWNVKVTIGESFAENYGGGCAANGPNISFTVPAGPAQKMYFAYVAATHCIRFNVGGRPRGDLRKARAHWLDQTTIAWDLGADPPAGATAELRFDPAAGLSIDPTAGLTGGTAVPLTFVPGGLTGALAQKFPHLKGLQVFQIAGGAPANLKTMLTGQLAVGLKSQAGVPLDATELQIPGVLDATYAGAAASQALGATWSGGVPTLKVWAPTAQDVKVLVSADPSFSAPAATQMTLDAATGVWSVTGQAGWKGQYYQYQPTVFTRATNSVVTNAIPDPYSVDAALNSSSSHLVDLEDPALKPANWDSVTTQVITSPVDIVLYELHVRDFSATDPTVPVAHQGRYLAFTDTGSNGMKHLKALADAGLTHVHLLPAFDFASVNEDSTTWQPVDFVTLRGQAPDAESQQLAEAGVANQDGFNWGYDPVLYGAPDGSYATNPSDGSRVLELRKLVQGLRSIGLRTVLDVVYNHTTASGQNNNSVLDKIVPGYYHRLNGDGAVEKSTCCENTATEHAMMGKLVVDTMVTWAREYKLGGFRFDIMGHMPKDVVLAARDAVHQVDPNIYLYGEGWNFGEVADNRQFVQAKQADMAGTGVGTFNDRIRDAVRGGSPFSAKTDQGFASGLMSDPNAAAATITPATQKKRLIAAAELIRLSMAGNLKTYQMLDSTGLLKAGSQFSYNDTPGAAYASVPEDTINYVSAHDNQTIFDAIQLKAVLPTASAAGDDLAARVRYNNLALAIVMLSQGVPFFHAGDEILRSKSADNNSYNSGDWFNQIDWSLQTNNWGIGAPQATDNGNDWAVEKPILRNTALRPGPAEMQLANAVFTEFLKIRKTEPLFRLRSAAAIQSQVTFYNVGATQVPGLIAMRLTQNPVASGVVEPKDGDLMVLFNGTPDPLSFQSAEFVGENYQLHPIQANGSDEVTRTSAFHPLTGQFTAAGRTAAVFQRVPGAVKLLPDTVEPTCSCATTGPNAAVGALALAALAVWLRRRTAAAVRSSSNRDGRNP